MIQDIDYTVDEKHHGDATEEGVVKQNRKQLLGLRATCTTRSTWNDSPRLPGAARAYALSSRRRVRRQNGEVFRRRIYRARNAGPGAGLTAFTRLSKPRKA